MEDAFPELRLENARAIGMAMKLHTWSFILLPQLWYKIELSDFGDNFDSITPIKYYIKNKSGAWVMNPLLDTQVPNDTGGIYMFCIKPPHIDNHASYLMYIGRAQKTNTQNLRKRIKEYHSEERVKIEHLFDYWKEFIYVKCIPVSSSNNEIKELEKKLINSFLPPCNSIIPDVTLRKAVSAF